MPCDFPDNMNFVCAALAVIIAGVNVTKCFHFCNLVIRVKSIIIETICYFCTKMKTLVTTYGCYIFCKCFSHFKLIPSASPVWVKYFVTFHNSSMFFILFLLSTELVYKINLSLAGYLRSRCRPY